MPAITTIKSQSAFDEHYRHLLEKGKTNKLAITAEMRKLLVTSLGVLNSNIQYDPN